MEHFYQKIQGFFDFENLYSYVVQQVQKNSTEEIVFVEVGSWKGRSAAFLAVEIHNSNKNIRLDCVDTWIGSNEDTHLKDPHVVNGTLFEHFTDNMKPVEKHYRPLRMSSLEAAKIYKDNSLDFVYIDASHYYIDVVEDIKAWLPKIKEGGILAGHDYITAADVKKAVTELLPRAAFYGPNSWFLQC